MDRQHRRDLKHDRFVDEIGSLSQSARVNQRLILMITAAVVGLAVVIYAIYFYRTDREQKAQNALSAAIETVDSPLVQAGQPNPQAKYKTEAERTAAAQKQFGEVTKNYSGTVAADLANVYLARLAADHGDVAQARTRLEEFLRDHPKSVVSGSARYSLYQLRLENGEASQVLQELETQLKSDAPSLPGDTILNLEASAYDVEGQGAKSKEVYRRLITEYPDSPYAIQAQRRVGPA